MKNESDPLLVLPAKTAATVRKNKRKKEKRNRCLLTFSLTLLAMVFGSMVAIRKAFNSDPNDTTPTSVLGRAKAAKSKVVYEVGGGDGNNDEGEYSVDWGTDIGPATTFADLAKIMLLPWYEASIMAVLEDPAWESGILPGNIKPIRRTLLITRDMLDVFSPVFPDTPDPLKAARRETKRKKNKKNKKPKKNKDRSVWKELRTLYRHGYQLAGELHDLKGLTYSDQLLEERVNAVLDWKREFLEYQKTHEIRRYLYQDGIGMDPNGCYYHKASHLFWADYAKEDLPCGNDSGPKSLRALTSAQLEHSLGYLDIIEDYTTVMSRDHEINFHNLRKELRIFVDEYNLFGNVLVPNNNDETGDIPVKLQERMDFLDKTQKKLGDINDKWTAHDVYVQDDSHPQKQLELANQTDALWAAFLKWEHKHNLRGVIEEVLALMNTNV